MTATSQRLCYAISEEGAFVVATFMGAKLAGASAETLNPLRRHLVL
jgi:hypothetical protein